jgi:glyoxylase I family protein
MILLKTSQIIRLGKRKRVYVFRCDYVVAVYLFEQAPEYSSRVGGLDYQFCFTAKVKMKVEHIGLCIEHPISVAEWWVAHLGFKLIRRFGTDEDGAAFIASEDGTVIEFARLEEVPSLDPHRLEFIQLHFALECRDAMDEAQRLEKEGATLIGESPRNAYRNEKVIIRDPWGNCIQLINRQEKLK